MVDVSAVEIPTGSAAAPVVPAAVTAVEGGASGNGTALKTSAVETGVGEDGNAEAAGQPAETGDNNGQPVTAEPQVDVAPAAEATTETREPLYWMTDLPPAQAQWAHVFVDAINAVETHLDLIYPPDSNNPQAQAARQAVETALAENKYVDGTPTAGFNPQTQTYTDKDGNQADFSTHTTVLMDAFSQLSQLPDGRPPEVDTMWKQLGEGGRLVTLKSGETKVYLGEPRKDDVVLSNLKTLLLQAIIHTKESVDFDKQSEIFHKLLAVNLMLNGGQSRLTPEAQIEIASQALEDLVVVKPGFLELQYDDNNGDSQPLKLRGVVDMYAETRTKAVDHKNSFSEWLYREVNRTYETGKLVDADLAELKGKRAIDLVSELESRSFAKQNEGKLEQLLSPLLAKFGSGTNAITKIIENPGTVGRINRSIIGIDNINGVSQRYREAFYQATGIDFNKFREQRVSLLARAQTLSPFALVLFGVISSMITEEEGGQQPAQ